MQLSPQLKDLSKPENIQQLASLLSELAEQLDPLFTETAPNGNISARIGRIAIYKNGSSYETWQNTTGSTVWQRIDYGIIDFFKTGDWIISSVTTARTGWTDKSSTYSDKFMRINATPLSTGGADTVTLSEANLPSHTHAAGTLAAADESAHTHPYILDGTVGAGANIDASSLVISSNGNLSWTTGVGSAHTHTLSGLTGAIGSGTAFDTIPSYVQVVIFEKD